MYKLPALPYEYGALEDYVSEEIMILHHTKHHQTYVDKLNAALESEPDLKSKTLEEMFSNLDSLPSNIRLAIRNHGGGHYNHSMFWQCMSPESGGEPSGELLNKITEKYGSFQAFVDEFTTKALGVFGSGWAWLQPDMEIITTPNQDNPFMLGKEAPVLCLDIWEHAYYLDYKNKRDDYIKAWWNIVNWDYVASRLT